MGIKLSGTQRNKTILLVICTIIAVGIIINEAIKNNKDINVVEQSKVKIEQQTKNSEISANKTEGSIDEKTKKLDEEYSKAFELFHSKKYDDAINIANEIIKEDSKNYKAYNIRGIAKAYKNRNLDEALADIDKSLEIKNDYGYARFNKGLTYELLGKYDEALTWYNKDLEVEEYVWTYYGMASIYGRRGDVDNTVKYLKMAIDKDSDVKKAARDEEDFNPVRNSDAFKNLGI